MAAVSISPYPPLHLLFFSNSRFPSNSSLNNTHNLALTLRSPLSLSAQFSEKQTSLSPKFHHRRTQFWRISASPEESLTSDTATPIDTSQQIISTSDDGTTSIISVLLTIAFIALSILTIGVIYIAVTDFLQKREGEKFDKEESAKKKKKKKGRVRSRSGPRGFGQKIGEDDDDDDEELK